MQFIKKIFNYLFPAESRVLRLFLWCLFLTLLAWLLWQGVVPSGKISYSHDFKKTNEFIGKLTPQDRVKTLDNGHKLIIGEPVYFSLRTPRSFDKAILKIEYKDSDDLAIVEAGVLADKTLWRYDLKPVANRTLDQLSYVWNKTSEADLLFLQREKKFNSIDEFLDNLPDRNKIALYNYDIKSEYIIKDYQKNDKKTVYDYPLRGAFEFYTYIMDEELDFAFNFLDINENRDSDQIDLRLYYGDELIDTRHMDDDGITADKGEKKPVRKLEFKIAGLPEGVYKIELRANDDNITNSIETSQKKLAFLNKLWLANYDKEKIELYTDSKKLLFKTNDPESRQTIIAGKSKLVIDETYKQFETIVEPASSTESVHKIELEKDGLMLAGNGVFSFNKDSLFDPNFKKADDLLDVDIDGVDYILAKYIEPKKVGDSKLIEVDFDLSKAYRENYKYSFLLSLPGLKQEDSGDKGMEIEKVTIELEGKSLWQKIKENL
jgi:hypothetical protein